MRAIYLLLLVVAATTHAASATGPDTLEALITRSETRCRQLAGKLQGCRAAGQDIALPDADLAVAQLFCRYSRYDAGQEKLRPAALRSMRYVDRLLTEQLARADRVLARKARYPRVPQYPAQGITWHNSGFWSGRRPVFLTGANWDAAEAQHDPGILHRLGFTLTDGMFRGSVRRDGSFDDDPFRMGDGRYLGLMDRAGFAVDCLTDASPPDWLVRETPGLAQRGYGNGFGYVFEHPQARGFQDRLLGHLAPVYADHPSVFAVDLANEPAFQGPSDLMLANWRAWLRRKYGTPQRLSRAWGIPMGSFDEVRRYPSQPEVMNGQWGRAAVDFGKPGVRGMHYDWCAFNNQRISAYFRSLSDRIHAGASRLATHVKMMLGLYFTGSTESRGWKMGLSYHTFGLDPEALARSLSLLGGDVDLVDLSEVPRPNRRFGSSPYVMGWLDASLAADFLKSLAPNKPYYDSELHLIEDSKPEVDPANSEAHLRAALWLSHLHGMSGNLLWYWSRDAQGAPMGTDWFAG
ncbi:MAG TPA: beta-galactosidase, partial [Armatimonadota bacterium]